MADIQEFLDVMTVPTLDNNFSTTFSDFCQKIINNFQKICSAPFLKGDRGSRVEMREEPLIEEGQWTDFAKAIVRAIYIDVEGNDAADIPLPLANDGLFITINNVDDYEKVANVDGGAVENDGNYIYSWQLLIDRINTGSSSYCPYIPVCYDQWTGNKEFWVPFFFFDGRTQYASKLANENLSGYYDMSHVVTGKYDVDEGEWKITISDTLPRLYFDEDCNVFCWEINGLRTGISAQGTKGPAGYSPQFVVTSGERLGSYDQDYILISNLAGVQAGDIALVFYDDVNGNPGAQMGSLIQTDESNWQISNNPDYNIMSPLLSNSLKYYLNTIGQDSSENPCAALYSPNPNSIADEVMALWVKNEDKHYIAPMRYADMESTSDLNHDPLDKELEIKYSKTTFSQGGVDVNGDVDINGTVNMNRLNSRGVPVTTPTIYRLAVITNILGINNKNKLGRLGYKESQGQVTDFQNNYDTDDLDEYLYIPIEMIFGWIPDNESPAPDLSDNKSNNPLNIYRAQKYYFTLKIPVYNYVGNSWSGPSNPDPKIINDLGVLGDDFTLFYDGGKSRHSAQFTLCISPNIRAYKCRDTLINSSPVIVYNNQQYYAHLQNNEYYLWRKPITYEGQGSVTMVSNECYMITGIESSGYPDLNLPGTSVSPSTQLIYLISENVDSLGYDIKNIIFLRPDNTLTYASPIYGEDSRQFIYPLFDSTFSFMSYPGKLDDHDQHMEYITTDDAAGVMKQGFTLINVLDGDISGDNRNWYNFTFINEDYFETLNIKDFNPYILSPVYDGPNYMSKMPYNAPIKLYPHNVLGVMSEM